MVMYMYMYTVDFKLLQIKNTLPFQVSVYSYDEKNKKTNKLGDVERDEGVFDVPLNIVANNLNFKFGVG